MAEQMDERIRRICGHRKVVFSAIASQKKNFHWYSNWKNEEFTCVDRSWQGLGHETFPDEVGMMECPQCDHGVAYLVFPNLTETEEAAATDNQEAIQDLPKARDRLKRRQARLARFEREEVKSPSQPPDLEGESLEFTWDFVQMDEENYQVIRTGEAEVWRELAFWDNIPRFNEIKSLLRERYGARFKSLTPTEDSLDWLTGDHFSKLRELTYS